MQLRASQICQQNHCFMHDHGSFVSAISTGWQLAVSSRLVRLNAFKRAVYLPL
jgi:hypothetical protein